MGGVGPAQREQVAPQPDLEGVAQGRPAHRLDAGAGQQPHLHQPARHARRAPDAVDHGVAADGKLVERVESLVHGGWLLADGSASAVGGVK